MRCCVRMTPRRGVRGRAVIETRRAQRRFGDRLIAAEVADLHGAWMRHADRALNDPQIVAAVDAALARRHPQSRRRGRPGVPAEVVLRVLVLKHIHNWSDQVLEREVRANLVDRDFTRVGDAKTPEAKTMGRWGVVLGPAVIEQIHARICRSPAKMARRPAGAGASTRRWSQLTSTIRPTAACSVTGCGTHQRQQTPAQPHPQSIQGRRDEALGRARRGSSIAWRVQSERLRGRFQAARDYQQREWPAPARPQNSGGNTEPECDPAKEIALAPERLGQPAADRKTIALVTSSEVNTHVRLGEAAGKRGAARR
jgi:hypothetical protein